MAGKRGLPRRILVHRDNFSNLNDFQNGRQSSQAGYWPQNRNKRRKKVRFQERTEIIPPEQNNGGNDNNGNWGNGSPGGDGCPKPNPYDNRNSHQKRFRHRQLDLKCRCPRDECQHRLQYQQKLRERQQTEPQIFPCASNFGIKSDTSQITEASLLSDLVRRWQLEEALRTGATHRVDGDGDVVMTDVHPPRRDRGASGFTRDRLEERLVSLESCARMLHRAWRKEKEGRRRLQDHDEEKFERALVVLAKTGNLDMKSFEKVFGDVVRL